jgi:hypothetical protein
MLLGNNDGHNDEPENGLAGEPGPLEALRSRCRARHPAVADEGPDDPFTDDDAEQIIDDTVNQHIATISRSSDDGTWMRLTYLMRGVKLIDFSMGSTGDEEPVVSLIISDDEAPDMIAKIIAMIGPDRRPAPDPDPPAEPRTQW